MTESTTLSRRHLLILAALLAAVLPALWFALMDTPPTAPVTTGPRAPADAGARRHRGRTEPGPGRHERDRAPETGPSAGSGTVAPSPDVPPQGTTREVPAEPTRVRVTVEDDSGAPAAAARVQIGDALAWARKREPDRAVEAETDRAGLAELLVRAGRTVRVVAWRGDLAAASERITVAGEVMDVSLHLAPGVTLRGRVLGTDAVPVAGAVVSALFHTEDPFGISLRATTGEDGEFSLPSVPEEGLLGRADLGFRAAGYVPAGVGVSVPGDGAPLAVNLIEGASVRGRCVDETGRPVGGVSIWTRGQGGTTESAGDGRFELDDFPRRGGVLCVLPRLLAPVVVEGPADAGPAADLGDIVLRPGGEVRGVVVDAEGSILPGALVTLLDGGIGRFARETRTDRDGRFVLRHVGQGPNRVTAHEPAPAEAREGRQPASAGVDDVQADGAEIRIAITGGLSLNLRFLAESDRSEVEVRDVKLTLTREDGTGSAGTWAFAGAGMRTVRIQVPEAGTYDVRVEIPGYLPGTVTGVAITGERESRVDVLFRVLPD